MADPNLVIPPSASLPAVEDVMEELDNQPTPDITSEIMQAVRVIEKVATTAKNLNGQYVRLLRSRALTVHAGLNILAHRSQAEQSGRDEEIAAKLRRKIRGFRMENERLQREVDQAAITRKEGDKALRESEELRRKIGRLEDELQEVKDRYIVEMDGGSRRAREGSRAPSLTRTSPPLQLSPPLGGGCGRPPSVGVGPRPSPTRGGGCWVT